jgi:hypothetical protein
MGELFYSGLITEIIVGLIVLEVAGLALYHRLTGRGPAPADTVIYLLSGLCLMLAVRAALIDAGWVWVAVWLTAGLVAHLLDLFRRWR